MSTVYNKITIDGTTYMDLSQDTVASANHIRSGYVGHLNDGTQVTGTYSSSGFITEIILSERSITATTADTSGYWTYVDGFTELLVDNSHYVVTMDGNKYICYTETLDQGANVYCGSPDINAGYIENAIYPFVIGVYSSRIAWGVADNQSHIVQVEKVINFDEAILTSKTITQNGTYNASSDSADGYSSVTVNVSGSLPTIQSLSVTPSTSEQTFNASNVDGYKPVVVAAMPTMTLPTSVAASATSGYTSKATISRSTSDQYINIPTGYNSAGGYYKINAVANGSATAPASISGTSATISTGTNTLTLTKTVSVTPTVTAGYVSSGTAGNSSVSLTASVTVNPTPTASGKTVTIPAGYYSTQTTKDVSTGSATGPSTVSSTGASVSTGSNTLTLTKSSVSITPTVSAGYISSGTASSATVSLTASVTTKAAATITPTTTNQTIASGTYLTGTQTISGDANLVSSNIISGVSIFGVSGNVVLQNYYTGSSTPSSGTGSNGDLYLQT